MNAFDGDPNVNAAKATSQRASRRRWLVATLVLLAALLHVPLLRGIIKRWTRNVCELVVDWPAMKDSNARGNIALNSHHCELVRPINLAINPVRVPRGHLSLMVEFKSNGPIVPERRMKLTLELLDAMGRVLAGDGVTYADERLQKRHMVPYGSLNAWVGPGDSNLVPFVLRVNDGRPAEVRLTFAEQM